MDGIGIGPPLDTNAVYLARTPILDMLFASNFYCELKAHGTAVGLPTDKDMGNSEVGHNNLGEGREVGQGARLVNRAIDTGSIFETPAWSKVERCSRNGGTVNFIGLLSDGNVHSQIRQLHALIDKCSQLGFQKVRLHALLDGRDVGERSALEYVIPTEEKLHRSSADKGLDYRVASGGGRMRVTMDRYNADWDMVRRGWDAHVLGKGRSFPSAQEAVRTMYGEDPGVTDQYLDAFVVVNGDGLPVGP
jgi:2,3-bisphosphoglycerate-independent phosphoglycerate mutase